MSASWPATRTAIRSACSSHSIDGFASCPQTRWCCLRTAGPSAASTPAWTQLHAHHRERCEAAGRRLRARRRALRTDPDAVPARMLDAHQTMFAMGEAIAHLNYLEHAGSLQRTERRRPDPFRQQLNQGVAMSAARTTSALPDPEGSRQDLRRGRPARLRL